MSVLLVQDPSWPSRQKGVLLACISVTGLEDIDRGFLGFLAKDYPGLAPDLV